jgi:hypothetical protein
MARNLIQLSLLNITSRNNETDFRRLRKHRIYFCILQIIIMLYPQPPLTSSYPSIPHPNSYFLSTHSHLTPNANQPLYSSLSTASLIAANSALGLAPTISLTLSAFLKIRKVGIARMPSSCATSGTSSTSSLTKWAPVNSSENLGHIY